MTVVRFALLVLAALLLLGAVVSYVVLLDRVETTTTVLAGASTACAFAAYALGLKQRGGS